MLYENTHVVVKLVKLLVRDALRQSILLLDETIPKRHGVGVRVVRKDWERRRSRMTSGGRSELDPSRACCDPMNSTRRSLVDHVRWPGRADHQRVIAGRRTGALAKRKVLGRLSEEVTAEVATFGQMAEVVLVVLVFRVVLGQNLLLADIFRAEVSVRRSDVQLAAGVTVRVQTLSLRGDSRTEGHVVVLGVTTHTEPAGTDTQERRADDFAEGRGVDRSQTEVLARHRVGVVQALPRDREAVHGRIAELEPACQRQIPSPGLPSLCPHRTSFTVLARGKASHLLSLGREIRTDRAFLLSR